MKPSLFIIEQSAKEFAKITQKKCYLTKPKLINESCLYLEATYAPVKWQEEGLVIHLLLSFYAPEPYDPELLLEDLIATTSALAKMRFLPITSSIEANVYHQSVREGKNQPHLKASWLVQVRFNPQESQLLLELLTASAG